MNNAQFAGFSYNGLNNLGDHIQSICTERLLPKIKKRFNRDSLGKVADSSRYIMIMNGWFSHNPQYFPPSNVILPLFWGFHVTDCNESWNQMLSKKCIDYLKFHSPIGCRDVYTQKRLISLGVNSFYSKCLSLTLPTRPTKPKNGWNILVDVPIPLPGFIEDNAIHVSHRISPDVSERIKFEQAQKLLELYRDFANLIVTTRLHCALPAIAMGIPVIFLGNPLDYRLSILSDIGVRIYNFPSNISDKQIFINEIKRLWTEINWEVEAVDLEDEKTSLINRFNELLNEKLAFTYSGMDNNLE